MSELVGNTIAGRYRVTSFLGRGGMAEVYKVWDQVRSAILAMKVLNADLAEDKVFLRRFKREAQTLSQLQHPNIVRFYGMGQDGDLTFILMDFIEGTTLRKEIFQAKGPFSTRRVLTIMRAVCAALNYSHQSHFIHCDIKPANIMIHTNGTVLVSDFGIARMTEAATATMVGAGTPAYMAPEQARGENPVPQTDIYSLGIILYEMLSGGERPFIGEHARITGSTDEKIRWEQMNLEPPPLRKLNPTITSDLEAVVKKCLEKSPDRRFSNTHELLETLTRAFSMEEQARREAEGKAHPEAQAHEPKQTEQRHAEIAWLQNEIETALADKMWSRAREKLFQLKNLGPEGWALANSLQKRLPGAKKLGWMRRVRCQVSIGVILGMVIVGIILGVLFSTGSILPAHPPTNTPSPVVSAGPVVNGYLYFTSNRDGKAAIYYMSPKGKVTQVTPIQQYDSWSPALAAKGYLYFTSNRNGKAAIYYMSPKGKVSQVTPSEQYDSWSPAPATNGYLYFTSNRNGKAAIYYMSPKGKVTQVTPSQQYDSWSPVLAANGYLYFSSNRDGRAAIYYMDPKGKVSQVTPGQEYESWGFSWKDELGYHYERTSAHP